MSASTVRSALGINLTAQTIEAVLVRMVDDRPHVVRRFARPRVRAGEESLAEDFASALPGLKTSAESDFTLQVGGASIQDDLDLDPAIRSLNAGGNGFSGNGVPGDGAPGAGGPRTFAGALQDILAECKEIGYDSPEIVFTSGMPDVKHVELSGVREGSKASKSWMDAVTGRLPFGTSKPDQALITALRAEYPGTFNADRVRFLSMTPAESGTPRHLALFPTANDSVTPTLNATFGLDGDVDAIVRRFDAEVELHLDVVRRYLAPKSDHTTAVVRVGSEDTLILFIAGEELRHVERLRSLTSYDAPDTIASRVLLYQDEQQIEELDAVLLIGGPRDERLLSGFRGFYPDAAVGRLHDLLVAEHVHGSAEMLASLTPESGPALAAALRLLSDEPPSDAFNLLDATARQKKRTMPFFAWHTTAMLVVLVAATLFFAWRYVDQQNDIDELRTRIDANPIALPDISPQQLQQRVDSLNAVHAQYARSLHVLDSLLLGSTEWSETIERTARQTRSIEGIWFEDWSINTSEIQLKGTALDRNRLARLARNLDGVVKVVTYADIDDTRVYHFEVTVPRVTGMPEAALRLREADLAPDAARSITAPAASAVN